MSYTVTPNQLNALLKSHEMSATCTVFRGSESLGEIPVVDANIFASYGTRGGRDGTLTVTREVLDRGLLNPLTDQVIIRTGIKGIVDVPIFTGRVDVVNDQSDGLVTCFLESRGVEAQRAAFETPWAVSTPLLSTSEVQKILVDVDSTWSVDTSMATPRAIPANLVWEEDRGSALDQICQGSSQVWQPDRTGGFVMYDNPYSIGPSLADFSVVTLRDGVDGCVVDVTESQAREGVYNSVTVVVERLDNAAPIRVTVRDTGASSLTMWGGLFGKQNLVVKNQNPMNTADATQLALRILRQSLAIQRSWRITVPHLPVLDPGDVFILWYRNVVTAQVVDSVEYSFQAGDSTTITSRELTLSEATIIS